MAIRVISTFSVKGGINSSHLLGTNGSDMLQHGQARTRFSVKNYQQTRRSLDRYGQGECELVVNREAHNERHYAFAFVQSPGQHGPPRRIRDGTARQQRLPRIQIDGIEDGNREPG